MKIALRSLIPALNKGTTLVSVEAFSMAAAAQVAGQITLRDLMPLALSGGFTPSLTGHSRRTAKPIVSRLHDSSLTVVEIYAW